MIFGAVEAVYYTLSVGPSGDDYTGLLCIPAGVVLVGLAALRLWRSRRNTPNHAWRYLRRILIGVVTVVAVYQTILPLGLGVRDDPRRPGRGARPPSSGRRTRT